MYISQFNILSLIALSNKCQFKEEELNERLIELVIASTPHDSLKNYLLSQKLGYKCNQLLIDSRKYEALVAGKQKIDDLNSAEVKPVDAINKTQICSRCGTMHKPRSCPAYIRM